MRKIIDALKNVVIFLNALRNSKAKVYVRLNPRFIP